MGWLGLPIFLGDVEAAEFCFEGIAAALAAEAGEAGGEDHAVIGERGGRDSVGCGGLSELGQHDRGSDAGVGGDADRIAGAVINPGQDLGVVSVCEAVVGEVGLPRFVGHRGFETNVRGAGFLLRLGGHQARTGEVATDCC